MVAAVGSLSKIEEKLSGFNFSRCNNYSLVNLNFVTKVEDYTVWLDKEPFALYLFYGTGNLYAHVFV